MRGANHACGNIKLAVLSYQTSDSWHGCEFILLLLTVLLFEVCLCVCEYKHVHNTLSTWRSEYNSVLLFHIVLRQGLSFLPIHCSLQASWLSIFSKILPTLPPTSLQEHWDYRCGFLCGFQGSGFRLSCLHSKHFPSLNHLLAYFLFF